MLVLFFIQFQANNKKCPALKNLSGCAGAIRVISTIFDSFFDTDSKNYINLIDLEEGYRLFSIEENSQKLSLILKRYSNNVKNDITYNDFVNMLTPYNNKHYRDIILQINKKR